MTDLSLGLRLGSKQSGPNLFQYTMLMDGTNCLTPLGASSFSGTALQGTGDIGLVECDAQSPLSESFRIDIQPKLDAGGAHFCYVYFLFATSGTNDIPDPTSTSLQLSMNVGGTGDYGYVLGINTDADAASGSTHWVLWRIDQTTETNIAQNDVEGEKFNAPVSPNTVPVRITVSKSGSDIRIVVTHNGNTIIDFTDTSAPASRGRRFAVAGNGSGAGGAARDQVTSFTLTEV